MKLVIYISGIPRGITEEESYFAMSCEKSGKKILISLREKGYYLNEGKMFFHILCLC